MKKRSLFAIIVLLLVSSVINSAEVEIPDLRIPDPLKITEISNSALISRYKALLEKSPNDTSLINQLAHLYMLNKDYANALEYYRKLTQIVPNHILALIKTAEIYTITKKYSDAVKYYLEALEYDPSNIFVYEVVVSILMEQNQSANAKKIAGLGLKKDSNSLYLNYTLGLLYYKEGKFGKAEEHFSKAKELSSSIDISTMYGNVQSAQRNYDDAIETYKKAINEATEANKKNIEQFKNQISKLWYNLAWTYSDKGSYEKAVEAFQNVLNLNPDDKEARWNYLQTKDKMIEDMLATANELYFIKDFKAAIDIWENALKMDKDNEVAKQFLAIAKEKLNERVEHYKIAAKAYLKTGKQREAYEQLQNILALDPKNIDAVSELAKLDRELKGEDKAETFYQKGLSEYQKGNLISARGLFKKVLSIYDGHTNAKLNLEKVEKEITSEVSLSIEKAKKFSSEGKLRETVLEFEKVARIDPEFKDTTDELVKARKLLRTKIAQLSDEAKESIESQKTSEAISKYKEVLKLDPENRVASEQIKILSGQAAVTVSADSSKIKKMYNDGVQLYLADKFEEALSIWQKALEIDPNNSEIQRAVKRAQADLKALKIRKER